MPCLLISAMALSQASVSGYVYEDSNKNQKKENKEKGIEGVAVSNGEQVVLTDKFHRIPYAVFPDQNL